MRICFLDVDGVLNSAQSFHENHEERLKAVARGDNPIDIAKKHQWPLGHLSEPHIEVLNRICEATGCMIVISSTWRKHKFEGLPDWLKQKGFRYSAWIIDRTDDLALGYGRGYEIQEWLNNTSENVTSFVILDDDWDMHHLMPYLVNTNFNEGLTFSDADLAIGLLNGDIESIPLHERRSEQAAYMTKDVWGEPTVYPHPNDVHG